MTINDAISVLKDFQAWRRYDGPLDKSPKMPPPLIIGEAIDKVIEQYETANENAEPAMVTLEEFKNLLRQMGEELDRRRKEHISQPIMPQTYQPPCFNGGVCTNPHHDCINCPHQGTTLCQDTTSNTLSNDR